MTSEAAARTHRGLRRRVGLDDPASSRRDLGPGANPLSDLALAREVRYHVSMNATDHTADSLYTRYARTGTYHRVVEKNHPIEGRVLRHACNTSQPVDPRRTTTELPADADYCYRCHRSA